MPDQHFKRILNLLRKVEARRVVLLCHHNADPDAICSAYAFSVLLNEVQPDLKVVIAAAQGVSKLSRQILKYIPMQIEASPRIEEVDAIFLLDTSTVQQLDEWKKTVENSERPIIVIDHHATHPHTQNRAAICVTDDTASSTCEIVFRLFKQAKVKLRRSEALALFLGILYDTKHFILATSETFRIISDLVNAGVNAEEAISILALPTENSERFARLKAASRLRIVRIGEWILVLSFISSYQASAARALISLGAHVAIVGGQKKGKLMVSMRASNDFCQKTGIHLGKSIAKPLENYVQGMGGGHDAAAGFNGEGELENALESCTKLLREALKSLAA